VTVSPGTDATEAFEDIGHSDEARALLPDMLIGELEKDGVCVIVFKSCFSRLKLKQPLPNPPY
jgi:cytochrome b involved in lipid metabolism